MILFPGRHLMSVLECHQLTPPNNMVESKNPWAVCEKSGWVHGAISRNHSSGRCAIIITTGKKSSSRLSGGCAIVVTTGKKDTVVCLAGARHQLIPPNKMVELKTYELCVKKFLLPTSHLWKKNPPNLHILTLIVLAGSFIKLWPENIGGNLQIGMALSIQ